MTDERQASSSETRAMAAQIRAILNRMEAQFLSAGDGLSGAFTRFGALTGEIEGLSSLVDDGPVSRLVAKVKGFSSELNDGLSGLAATLVPLGALWSVSQDLNNEAGTLFRQIRMMNIVALNARVNAVSLSDEAAGLTAFTEDAKNLVDEASLALKQVMTELGAIDDHATRARELAAELSQSLLREASASARDLDTRVSGFQEKLIDLKSTGNEFARKADAIAGSVGSAVVALQSGDATRQRLEHIETILEAAESIGSYNKRGRALQALARRHLEASRAAHSPSIDQAVRALDNANRDIAALMSDLDRNFARDLKGTEEIRASVKSLRDHIDAGARVREQLRETAEKISVSFQNVNELARRLDALDEDMRLIGFNAVIACAGLGERALALKEVAKQLRELAEALTKPHAALKRRLVDLKQIVDQAEGQLVDSARNLDQLASVLSEDLADDVDEIGTSLMRLFRVIGESQTRLSADVSLGLNSLRTHANAFNKLFDMPGVLDTSLHDARIDEETAMIADQMREILTIEAERIVHDAWREEVGPVVRRRIGFADDAETANNETDDNDTFEEALPSSLESTAPKDNSDGDDMSSFEGLFEDFTTERLAS